MFKLDFNTLITSIFLWILFGRLNPNCDLDKLLTNNIYFRHIIGYMSVLLLFIMYDDKVFELSTIKLFQESILIYILFILATKSKLIFIIVLFINLLLDQYIKFKLNKTNNDNEKQKLELIRKYSIYSSIGIIIIGFIFYFLKQKNDYGDDFNLYTFLLSTKCQS